MSDNKKRLLCWGIILAALIVLSVNAFGGGIRMRQETDLQKDSDGKTSLPDNIKIVDEDTPRSDSLDGNPVGIAFSALHSGINIGNSLDVKGVLENKPNASVADFETEWHNPQISETLMDAIANAGFHTVRIPVSWGEHIQEDGKINTMWMERVKTVVKMAYKRGLYIILDTHHEDWLIPTKEKEKETTERLVSLWTQIAEEFKGVDYHLIFEGMNEPRLMGTEMEWTSGTEESREVISRLNLAFVQAVRSVGANNSTRKLMICGYGNSPRTEALSAIQMPENDDNILISVHAYVPFSFAHQEDGERTWSMLDINDTMEIDRMMNNLDEMFLQRGIPVVITEFGCKENVEESSRNEWVSYYTQKAYQKGIPCIWWDNGSDFSLINRESGEWTQPTIVDSLLRGPQI